MAAVDVEAITVDVAVVNALLAFVDVGATDSITTVAIDTSTSESADAVCARCFGVTSSLAVCTLINIDTLAFAEHESWQAGAVEGTRIVYTR